jgi:hypothetical protein
VRHAHDAVIRERSCNGQSAIQSFRDTNRNSTVEERARTGENIRQLFRYGGKIAWIDKQYGLCVRPNCGNHLLACSGVDLSAGGTEAAAAGLGLPASWAGAHDD